MKGILTHKPTGLRVNPANGRIFAHDRRVPGYRTPEGVPVVMVRTEDGESATVYPSALIVWEACNGPVPEGMTLVRTSREPRLSSLRLAPVSEMSP
jgi:hypothetical protein